MHLKAQFEHKKSLSLSLNLLGEHIQRERSFCLLGDLGFSRRRAPVKFNFLPGPLALSAVGLTWCDRSDSGHVTGGFGSEESGCHRENSQPGRSPTQSPLMVLRHTLLSSANGAQSISAQLGAWSRGWACYHRQCWASSGIFSNVCMAS